MSDQASTLRRIASQRGNQTAFPASGRAKGTTVIEAGRPLTLAVTSGKGGVGKSNFAVNVALELAGLGKRVALLDADLALANMDVLLGLNPPFHLGHVLRGERTLDEIVIEVANGLRLIPGGSGIEELANLARHQHTRLVQELQAFEADADVVLVDTAAGLADNVTGVLRAADQVIVVTTPDPTAVVDAYAMIKVIHQQAAGKPIRIVVNEVIGIGDAERIFAQLQAAATRFLDRRLSLLGTIPRDAELVRAVREQVPVVWHAPDTASSRAMRLIARHLKAECLVNTNVMRNQVSFWTALMNPLALSTN
jgi:flagellar biosynthesis protein FlhG